MKNVIYRIHNTRSGRNYVGSAYLVGSRWKSHKHLLRKGKHHSPSLQRSWDKHGEGAFVFEVLEKVESRDILLQREQHWIDTLKAADPDLGFNVSPVAGTRRGVPQPPSVAEKLRKVHLGKPKSEEQRAKMSASARGRTKSPEHRASLAEATRRAHAEGRLAGTDSTRFRAGQVSAFAGKSHSEASKGKLRQAAIERNKDPAHLARLREQSRRAAEARRARRKAAAAATTQGEA